MTYDEVPESLKKAERELMAVRYSINEVQKGGQKFTRVHVEGEPFNFEVDAILALLKAKEIDVMALIGHLEEVNVTLEKVSIGLLK